jgi:riboflavin biosynthesis pyrimidine reductase
VRGLIPHSADDVVLRAAYAVPDQPDDDVFVRLNMIQSIDGAIAINGRSGALGGPADHRVFEVLRSLADMILVGAGTFRAEGYGPARLSAALRAAREATGQSPVPPIAVVTRSCHLDWDAPFFTDTQQRPLVITTSDSDERARRRAGSVAEVIVAGDGSVDLRQAVHELGTRGVRSVLAEGGPGLNAQLVDEDLVDELCLTLSPCVVAGTGSRILAGPERPHPLPLTTVHLLEDNGTLFYRFQVCPYIG